MQKTTSLLCSLFFVVVLSAQSKSENYNSLLWRISGNGLTKPSYVYGTIHITDKRVFHFTDSLYKSLEQCEGFAAELDINTFFNEYFNSFMGEDKVSKNSKKLLVDSLDKKLLARYKVQLEKKFNKSINDITVGEVSDASDSWMRGLLKNGEMNTFMDAWLFDVARRQGKWVGGIEDYADQEGLKDSISLVEKLGTITSNDGEPDAMIEEMIKLYLQQQLDSIDRSDDVWQGSRDALLVRRNIKMARRMDSLARIRSMLFAVGAAHIPSNEGVIYLLRQKGFTVTPVYSKKRIAPEDYTYKKVELPWHDVAIPDSSYKITMPGPPIKSRIDDEDSPEMNIHVDLGNFRAYITLGIPVPASRKNSADSMLKNLVTYYKETMTITEKDIVVNGYEGKEIVGRDEEDAEIRMQLFIGPSFLIMNAVSGFKRTALYGDEPERFFNSFAIKNRSQTALAKGNKKWERYSFSKYGFSVELPLKYQEEKLERDDESWEQKFFRSFDLSEATFMGIIISNVKKGYYSNSDSSFFEESAQGLTTNMNAEITSKRHFFKDGYPAFTASAQSSVDKENIAIRILLVNKGPRRYLLFTTAEKNNNSDASDIFFDSFKFLPEENANWSKKFSPDKTFTIWSPSTILNESDGSNEHKEIKYFILDTVSNMQIFVDKEIFPDYFWARDDTTLLTDKIKTYIGDNDSAIFNKPFTIGKLKGVDLLVQLSGTHNLKRLRAILNGDTLYTIYSFLPSQYIESANYQKLFNDFKINFETTSSSLYKRKPEQLLLALQTKDSADFEKAKEVFEYVTFLEEDVPYLQKALLHFYYGYDSTYYYSTNSSISGLIERLDGTHSSIAFAKENYPRLTGDKELMKPFLLSLLSFIKTNESYAALKNLLISSPPKISREYYWRNGLYDSLPLTKNLFPDILLLAGDPGAYDFINDLTLAMLDSNFVDLSAIKKYKNEFIKSGKRILSLPKEKKEEHYYYYSSLAKLLGKINDPEGNEILKRLGGINANSLKLDVALAQAATGQQPDTENLKTLAVSDEFRQKLYDGLAEIKKTNLFPKEFFNQKALAQSTIFEYANEDDYPPDVIEFIEERTDIFMGKKQKFYLFKICFKKEEVEIDECYFAAVGPYSLDQKNLESKHQLTEIRWDEKLDNTMINEWFKDMIKRTEAWIKERKD